MSEPVHGNHRLGCRERYGQETADAVIAFQDLVGENVGPGVAERPQHRPTTRSVGGPAEVAGEVPAGAEARHEPFGAVQPVAAAGPQEVRRSLPGPV